MIIEKLSEEIDDAVRDYVAGRTQVAWFKLAEIAVRCLANFVAHYIEKGD